MPDNTKRGMLFIHAQTPLHPGSGSALGVVDLPVQRERHTDWPVIPGSSIKGVVRAHCRPANFNEEAAKKWTAEKPKNGESPNYIGSQEESDQKFIAAFGGVAGTPNPIAGAVSFSDGILLFFPVRSLKGVFAMVTCPYALKRFERAGGRHGIDQGQLNAIGDNQRKALATSNVLKFGDKAVVEEFDLNEIAAIAANGEFANGDLANDALLPPELRSRVLVVSDNLFTHFAKNATEVIQRNKLDYETKTVDGSGLFSEELLPAETILWSSVQVAAARFAGGDTLNEVALIGHLRDNLNGKTIQIGGDESVGRGFCTVNLRNIPQNEGQAGNHG